MKKVSLLLALLLSVSLALPAFADNDITITGSTSVDVPATYVPGTVTIVGPDGTAATATIYSVDISWTAITAVKYSGGNTAYRWDADKQAYVESTTGSTASGWDKDKTSCTITVKNSSNAAIKATASFAKNSAVSATVSCAFTNNDVTIPSAAPSYEQLIAGTTQGSIQSASIIANISASGTLSNASSLGSITVLIAPATT